MIDRRGSLSLEPERPVVITPTRFELPRLGPAYKEVLQDIFAIRSGGRLFANLALYR
jgi:hypothetical protein